MPVQPREYPKDTRARAGSVVSSGGSKRNAGRGAGSVQSGTVRDLRVGGGRVQASMIGGFHAGSRQQSAPVTAVTALPSGGGRGRMSKTSNAVAGGSWRATSTRSGKIKDLGTVHPTQRQPPKTAGQCTSCGSKTKRGTVANGKATSQGCDCGKCGSTLAGGSVESTGECSCGGCKGAVKKSSAGRIGKNTLSQWPKSGRKKTVVTEQGESGGIAAFWERQREIAVEAAEVRGVTEALLWDFERNDRESAINDAKAGIGDKIVPFVPNRSGKGKPRAGIGRHIGRGGGLFKFRGTSDDDDDLPPWWDDIGKPRKGSLDPFPTLPDDPLCVGSGKGPMSAYKPKIILIDNSRPFPQAVDFKDFASGSSVRVAWQGWNALRPHLENVQGVVQWVPTIQGGDVVLVVQDGNLNHPHVTAAWPQTTVWNEQIATDAKFDVKPTPAHIWVGVGNGCPVTIRGIAKAPTPEEFKDLTPDKALQLPGPSNPGVHVVVPQGLRFVGRTGGSYLEDKQLNKPTDRDWAKTGIVLENLWIDGRYFPPAGGTEGLVHGANAPNEYVVFSPRFVDLLAAYRFGHVTIRKCLVEGSDDIFYKQPLKPTAELRGRTVYLFGVNSARIVDSTFSAVPLWQQWGWELDPAATKDPGCVLKSGDPPCNGQYNLRYAKVPNNLATPPLFGAKWYGGPFVDEGLLNTIANHATTAQRNAQALPFDPAFPISGGENCYSNSEVVELRFARNVAVQDCVFGTSSHGNLVLNGCSNVLVEECDFANRWHTNLGIARSARVVVRRNAFLAAGSTLACVTQAGSDAYIQIGPRTTVRDIYIEHNEIVANPLRARANDVGISIVSSAVGPCPTGHRKACVPRSALQVAPWLVETNTNKFFPALSSWKSWQGALGQFAAAHGLEAFNPGCPIGGAASTSHCCNANPSPSLACCSGGVEVARGNPGFAAEPCCEDGSRPTCDDRNTVPICIREYPGQQTAFQLLWYLVDRVYCCGHEHRTGPLGAKGQAELDWCASNPHIMGWGTGEAASFCPTPPGDKSTDTTSNASKGRDAMLRALVGFQPAPFPELWANFGASGRVAIFNNRVKNVRKGDLVLHSDTCGPGIRQVVVFNNEFLSNGLLQQLQAKSFAQEDAGRARGAVNVLGGRGCLWTGADEIQFVGNLVSSSPSSSGDRQASCPSDRTRWGQALEGPCEWAVRWPWTLQSQQQNGAAFGPVWGAAKNLNNFMRVGESQTVTQDGVWPPKRKRSTDPAGAAKLRYVNQTRYSPCATPVGCNNASSPLSGAPVCPEGDSGVFERTCVPQYGGYWEQPSTSVAAAIQEHVYGCVAMCKERQQHAGWRWYEDVRAYIASPHYKDVDGKTIPSVGCKRGPRG